MYVCVCVSVCFTQSWDGVGIYRRALCFMSVCFRLCVWMRTRLKPLLPLWGGALKSKPTSGTKNPKTFYFKKSKLLHLSHDNSTYNLGTLDRPRVLLCNNPLIDNCSESTLKNQMFSDLYTLRNRGVCGITHWNTTQILKKAHHRQPSTKYILSPATEYNHDFVCSFFPESS